MQIAIDIKTGCQHPKHRLQVAAYQNMLKSLLHVEKDEESHRYFFKGNVIPSVTQVIEDAFPFKSFNNTATERSIQFGKAVHKAIELEVKGVLDYSSVDDAIVPYLSQWNAFCKDKSISVISGERVLYSKTHGIAGTVDIVAECDCKMPMVVYLEKDKYEVVHAKLQDWGCFLSVLNLYNWRRNESL